VGDSSSLHLSHTFLGHRAHPGVISQSPSTPAADAVMSLGRANSHMGRWARSRTMGAGRSGTASSGTRCATSSRARTASWAISRRCYAGRPTCTRYISQALRRKGRVFVEFHSTMISPLVSAVFAIPVPGGRAPAIPLGELCDSARRVHHDGHGELQREAQRGQWYEPPHLSVHKSSSVSLAVRFGIRLSTTFR
jgi:hypothetical protein